MSGDVRADKWIKLLKILLIVGSVLAAVKVIFVDYTLDEEYQVVMAYRRVSGDTLFGTMWEPHQTSAFLCVFLMRLFMAVTGTTTGVVLFLRVCTTVIQFLLAFWMYKTLRLFLEKDYAFLLGATYFNIVPKIIQIPEFSNLQVWCCTVTVLALLWYYKEDAGRRFKLLWLIVAGLGMALSVLAYPASLLLFPFFMCYICYRSARESGTVRTGIRDAFLFVLTCGCCAAVWLGALLVHVPAEEFLRNVRYVVDFDATHDMSLGAEYRMTALFRDFKTLAVLVVIVLVIAFCAYLGLGTAWKRRGMGVTRTGKKPDDSGVAEIGGVWKEDTPRMGSAVFAVLAVLAGEAVQLWYWLGFQSGYEIPQMHLIVILFAALLLVKDVCVGGKNKDANAGRKNEAADTDRKNEDACTGRQNVIMGLCAGLLVIISVLYMSDLGLWYAVPHGLVAVPFAVSIILYALRKQCGGRERFWTYLLLFSLAFVSVFGKGFVLRAGMMETNTVLGVRGLIKKGPAAGVLTNYIQAYITNETYDEFEKYVKPGSNCLIVTNMNGAAGTSPYMFNGAKVCHFSIVDPTTYDERLLEYWELYPEKRPDVIVVDCWYGELKEAPDSWIMRYIEGEFGYTETVDGKYVRYYIKR